MAIFTTGLADALDDVIAIAPTRWMDDVLGGFEGAQDRMTSLRLTSGSEVQLLSSVDDEAPRDAFFVGTYGAFTLDDRNDDFLLSGFDHGIGGDWNDLAVSAGQRAGRGFEISPVQARLVVGVDREIPDIVPDVPSPEIWPGASDDDFLLMSKDADLPLVLPGVEDFDHSVTRMSDSFDQPTRWTNHMLTFGEDVLVLGPTDYLGRPSGHDDWLF